MAKRAAIAAAIIASAGASGPALARDADRIVVGAGIAATPARQGSRDLRVLPLPAIDIRESWIFANLRNGIGVIPISSDSLDIGVSAVFLQGYRTRDVPTGIDRLSDGLGARAFANIRAGGLTATLGATKGVSGGTKGVIVDASLSYPIPVTPRLMLTPVLGATWADRNHNDRYFGITPAEARASGLPGFTTGAGIKDLSGTLTMSYRLTDRITVSATGGATVLVGDVANSPLVERKAAPSGILTLTYRL